MTYAQKLFPHEVTDIIDIRPERVVRRPATKQFLPVLWGRPVSTAYGIDPCFALVLELSREPKIDEIIAHGTLRARVVFDIPVLGRSAIGVHRVESRGID